jgi:hypothetical protein
MSQQSATTRLVCDIMTSFRKCDTPWKPASSTCDAGPAVFESPPFTSPSHSPARNDKTKRKRAFSDLRADSRLRISTGAFEAIPARSDNYSAALLGSALATPGSVDAAKTKRLLDFSEFMPAATRERDLAVMQSPNRGIVQYDLESCVSEMDNHQERGEYFTQDDCSVRSPSPMPAAAPVLLVDGRFDEFGAKHIIKPFSPVSLSSVSGAVAPAGPSNDKRAAAAPPSLKSRASNSDRKYGVEDLRAALVMLAEGSTDTTGMTGGDQASASASSASKPKVYVGASMTKNMKQPTVRATAKAFGIPPETLRRFWKKVSQEQPVLENRIEAIRVMNFPLLGNQRKRYFSETDERELALSLVNSHGDQASGLSEKEISVIACQEAKRRGVSNARCGKRWVSGFLRRNDAILKHWRQDRDKYDSKKKNKKRKCEA